MAVDIGGMRKPYGSKEDVFDFKHLVAREPFAQFKAWFDEATKNEKVQKCEERKSWLYNNRHTRSGIRSKCNVLSYSFG